MANARALSELCAGPVLLKCENLQRTGSFKIRGAYADRSSRRRAARAGGRRRQRGQPRAGGRARRAGTRRGGDGVHAGAGRAAVAATRRYGATVHLVGATIDESLDAAHEFADRTGAVLVHPFDHVDVIAGQGTVGLEILEQCPDVATVLVPLGGGGLLGGSLRPCPRGCGWSACRPPGGGVAAFGGRAGAHRFPTMRTLADGIAVGRPGDVTFRQVTALVEEIVTVDDDALSRALLYCLERAKLLVEPAGAAAVAALLEHPRRFPTPAVAVLSGRTWTRWCWAT